MKYFLLGLLPVFVLAAPVLTGCAGSPIPAPPVTGFTRREDGKITVHNRGLKDETGKYKDATGKAKFADSSDKGHLKVSFFGPFYGDYIIFDLDKSAYSRAYVSGGRDNYLWLLSRTPTVPESVRQDFIAKSSALGYEIEELIWVDQSKSNP